MLNNISKVIKIFVITAILSASILINTTSANNLKIKYYKDFPSTVQFDEKYYQQDKYLIYKYLSFSFDQEVDLKSVRLSFLVDKKWYDKNKIEDVIFLRYDNGSWLRINYQDKEHAGKYIKYIVSTDSIGKYWAIIGVLPNSNSTKLVMNTGVLKNTIGNEKSVFSGVNYLENLSNVRKKIVLKMKEPVSVKGINTITTTAATISLLALLFSVNGFLNLFLLFLQMLSSMFSLLPNTKERKRGIVYEVNTGKPIPLVRIDLINRETNKVQATKFTNGKGLYYFLAPQGKYKLEIHKKGYSTIDSKDKTIFNNLLKQEDLKLNVELNKSGVIEKNIALLKNDFKLSQFKFFKTFFWNRLWLIIFNMIFVIGFLLSIWSVYVNPKVFNFIILSIYIIIILFKLTFLRKSKYGVILNSKGRPEGFAVVKVLDPKTKKLVARAVTNAKGIYYIVLDPGEYLLNVRTADKKEINKKIKVIDRGSLENKIIVNN